MILVSEGFAAKVDAFPEKCFEVIEFFGPYVPFNAGKAVVVVPKISGFVVFDVEDVGVFIEFVEKKGVGDEGALVFAYWRGERFDEKPFPYSFIFYSVL